MSESNGSLDFSDLTPRVETIPIGNEVYTLKPASANSVIAFRTKSAQAARYGNDGKLVGWEGLANVEPYLVSQCLYDSQGRLVPDAKIRQWPNKVLKALFKIAFEISDIEERRDQSKEQLLSALSREDSPVKLDDLRAWVSSLEPRADYEDVLNLLKSNDRRELVKN